MPATDNLTALRARDDLLHVVRSWPELEARLAAGGGNALTGLPGGEGDHLPIDVAVSDLMRLIEERARFYAHVLLEEIPPGHGCDGACHGAPGHDCAAESATCAPEGEPVVAAPDCPSRRDPVTTSTMPGLLKDVIDRFGHFTHGDDERLALDFCDDAHEMVRMVDGLLIPREPADYIGPCPVTDHDGAGCPGELYLRPGQARGWCRECGTEYTRGSQQKYLMAQVADRLMPLSEITSALHVLLGRQVPYRTIQSWARRKRLVERTDGLYLLADALELATGQRVMVGTGTGASVQCA